MRACADGSIVAWGPRSAWSAGSLAPRTPADGVHVPWTTRTVTRLAHGGHGPFYAGLGGGPTGPARSRLLALQVLREQYFSPHRHWRAHATGCPARGWAADLPDRRRQGCPRSRSRGDGDLVFAGTMGVCRPSVVLCGGSFRGELVQRLDA